MERLGRITTSLPDLPINRRMTYGAMRRAIIGLPVTVSSAILPDGPQAHVHGEALHFGARALALAARRHVMRPCGTESRGA